MIKNTFEAEGRRSAKNPDASGSTPPASPLADIATATRLAEVEKKLADAESARRKAVMETSLRDQMAEAGISPNRLPLALAAFRGQHADQIEWDGDDAYVRKSKDEAVPLADFVKSFATSPDMDIFRAPRQTPGSVKKSSHVTSAGQISRSEFNKMTLSGLSPETASKVASGQILIVDQ